MIKPEFWSDRSIGKMPRDVRLTFLGLISNADDFGKLPGDPLVVRAMIFPYDKDLTAKIVDKWLRTLHNSKRILRYESGKNRDRYIIIPNFRKHQKIDKRWQRSDLPDPPKADLESLTENTP